MQAISCFNLELPKLKVAFNLKFGFQIFGYPNGHRSLKVVWLLKVPNFGIQKYRKYRKYWKFVGNSEIYANPITGSVGSYLPDACRWWAMFTAALHRTPQKPQKLIRICKLFALNCSNSKVSTCNIPGSRPPLAWVLGDQPLIRWAPRCIVIKPNE